MLGTGPQASRSTVFVPAERTVLTYGAPLVTPGPRYKIPLTLGFAAGDGMVALGLARSCIDAFFEVAGTKMPRNMQGLLRDQVMTQFAVGQAEATVRLVGQGSGAGCWETGVVGGMLFCGLNQFEYRR